KGLCKGIRGYGIGYVGEEEVIRLELHAYVGADEYEEIIIEGREYSVKWKSTGTHGDLGTVAILLNIAGKIHLYGPGLLTMVDLLPFKPYFKVG
ncbi:MAG: dihydrodipicolinate reductase, partial [Desulfurococcales archaeon ex4484_58]